MARPVARAALDHRGGRFRAVLEALAAEDDATEEA
jgi:hypothetical protein